MCWCQDRGLQLHGARWMDCLVVLVPVFRNVWHRRQDAPQNVFQPGAEIRRSRLRGARAHRNLLPHPPALPFLHGPPCGRRLERVGILEQMYRYLRNWNPEKKAFLHQARPQERRRFLHGVRGGRRDLWGLVLPGDQEALIVDPVAGTQCFGGHEHPEAV